MPLSPATLPIPAAPTGSTSWDSPRPACAISTPPPSTLAPDRPDPRDRPILAAAVEAAIPLRRRVVSTLVPITSGERVDTLCIGSGGEDDGAMLLHLADALLRRGTCSLAIPVPNGSDASAPVPVAGRNLAERLLLGSGVGVGNSFTHGQVWVSTWPVRQPEGVRPGLIDVTVEAEGGRRGNWQVAVQPLPLRRPVRLVACVREAIRHGDGAREAGADPGLLPGLLLIHERGMIDREPSLAAIAGLRTGGTVSEVAADVEACARRIGARLARVKAKAKAKARTRASCQPPRSSRPPPPPSPPPARAVSMAMGPTPVVQCPPDQLPAELGDSLVGLIGNDLRQLSARLARPGGVLAWCRRRLWDRPKSGNEVLLHVREIAKRLATAYVGSDARHRDARERQLNALMSRCVDTVFRDLSYPQRKAWVRRLDGEGSGDARRALRELEGIAAADAHAAGSRKRPVHERIEARFALDLLDALRMAPRQRSAR